VQSGKGAKGQRFWESCKVTKLQRLKETEFLAFKYFQKNERITGKPLKLCYSETLSLKKEQFSHQIQQLSII